MLANVLRELHQALESYPPLIVATGHVAGATSLANGARIIGDAARLRPHPVPGIVIGLGSRTAGRGGPSQPEKNWVVTLTIYGRDIFEAASISDALEQWIADARWKISSIRRVQWESAQQVEVSDDQQFIVLVVNLSISYIGGS